MRIWVVKASCILVPLMVLLCHHQVLAQDEGLLFTQNYSSKDYPGDPQNWEFVQDDTGLIYAANQAGVMEYDGTNWRLIEIRNKFHARSLTLGKNNQIYVGSKGDFGLLEPDEYGRLAYSSLRKYVDSVYWDYNDVRSIQTRGAQVFFKAEKYLFCWNGKSINVIEVDPTFPELFKVYDQIFLQNTEDGLVKLIDNRLESISGGQIFKTSGIHFMIPHANGKILIGTVDHGLFLYDGVRLQELETEIDHVLTSRQVSCGIRLPNGNIVIGTLKDGLFVINQQGKLLRSFNKKSGIVDNMIFSLMNDSQGGLWLGTDNGISRIQLTSPFSRFDESTGVDGVIVAIARYKKDLYLGTTQGLLVLKPWEELYDAKEASTTSKFISIDGIKTQAWSLLPTHGSLLIGTTKGLYRLQNNQLTRITKRKSYTLHKSKTDTNRVYIGLDEGLEEVYYTGNRWQLQTKIPNIYEEIRTMAEVVPGEIWLGAVQTGPMKMENGEIKRYGSQHGLPNSYIEIHPVKNEVVFSTDQGIFKFDRQTETFSRNTKIPIGRSNVTLVTPGYHDDLFIVSKSENITRINRGFISNTNKYVFDDNIFLRIPAMNIYGMLNDPNGVSWFGGSDGLIRFDEGVKTTETNDYNVHIRKVLVNADSLVYAGGKIDRKTTALAYQENNLGFEFSATSFDSNDQNQYKYMLVGQDQKWSSWTKDTKKGYTNISEGNYLFKVVSKNVYNIESPVASYAFKISPPWYRSYLAYVLYVTSLVLFIVGIVRLNAKRLKTANLKLETLVRNRTAEIEKKNHLLEEQKNEILQKTDELAKKAEELEKAYQEITLNNDNLEKTIVQRTQEIKNKNAQLLNYAFSNAHKVRGPLSRILGLIQLINMDKTSKDDLPLYLGHIHRSANELDSVIKEINVRLEKDDSTSIIKSKTRAKKS